MSLDISGQVGCQRWAALSVRSLVYTDSDTLSPSVTAQSVWGQKSTRIEKLSLVFLTINRSNNDVLTSSDMLSFPSLNIPSVSPHGLTPSHQTLNKCVTCPANRPPSSPRYCCHGYSPIKPCVIIDCSFSSSTSGHQNINRLYFENYLAREIYLGSWR